MSQEAARRREHATTALWSDNPSPVDLLGFRDATDLIAKAVLHDGLDPVTVGIEGDWGSGKTSMLQLLATQLRSYDSVVVVETHPWEYDPATDAKATLIAEVLDAIHKETDRRRLLDKVRERFRSLAKRVRISKLVKLAVSSAAVGGLPKVADILDLFNYDAETVPDPTLQGFREEFEELMKALPELRRVVVLVDDLDRCLPQTVVATLEAVKLFLSVKGMAFVLAADRRAVAHAVSTKYEPSPHASELGRQYSEKIIQIPVPVPALLRPADSEAYLALLMLQRHDLRGDQLERLIQHCKGRRAATDGGLFDEAWKAELDAAANEDLQLAAMLAQELHERLNGNPRRLKRFLNAYFMRDSVVSRSGIDVKPEALMMWMVLEECEPEAFEKLVAWWRKGELQQQLEKLKEGQRTDGAGSQAEVLVSWAQRAPTLAELNPDSYLGLAAPLRRREAPKVGQYRESFSSKPETSVDSIGNPYRGFGSIYGDLGSPHKDLGIIARGLGNPHKDFTIITKDLGNPHKDLGTYNPFRGKGKGREV